MNSTVGTFIAAFFVLLALGLAILDYALRAISIQRLAKRREIGCAWMAWVPVLSAWITGRITKHYDKRNGQKRNWDVVMFVMSLLFAFGMVAYVVSATKAAVISAYAEGQGHITRYVEKEIMEASVGMIVTACVCAVLGTIYRVVQTLCFFKIFESTVPNRALTYIILSSLIPLAGALCLFSCKDKGYEIAPAWGTVPPVNINVPPIPPQPGYQPEYQQVPQPVAYQQPMNQQDIINEQNRNEE